MPYPNEHSARLKDPNSFNPDTFRRAKDGTIYGKIKVPQTAATIWGKLKGKDKPADYPVPQALRFPVKYWTEEKARKWLKDNKVKYIKFEPAKKKKDKDKTQSVKGNIYSLIAALQAKIWAMEPRALEIFFRQIDQMETWLPDDVEIETAGPKLRIDSGAAVIDIKGVLMQDVPRAFVFWGIESTSYRTIRNQLNEAANNEKVKSIILRVNSPGGMADSGIIETADLIRTVRAQKPVTAIIEDMGASAAYWLASQADIINVEANSETGSIGVYTVYVDSSKKYEDAGLKVHVIKTGPYKAMGVPGAEITAEQISSIQQVVNGILDNFIDAVAAGRKKSAEQIRELADGRLWLADKAAKMGLADKVIRNSSQTLIEKMKGDIMESEQQQVDIQVELNEAKEKAKEQSLRDERERIKAITSEFADDAEFALEAIDKGWDVKEAKAQYCDVLKKKLAEKPQADGAEPLTENGEGGEKIVDFNEAAKALAKEEKIALGDAYKKIARQQPGIYQSYRESIGLPKTG